MGLVDLDLDLDLDLDGDLDVHVATHEQRDELVWQQVGGAFVPRWDVMRAMGAPDARGSAYGDVDGDGDLDVVVARRGEPLRVLRNDTAAGAWSAVAPRPLGAAPGALVTVDAGGRRRVAVVQAGSSYLSTSPPVAVFGLGELDAVDRIEVRFIDGTVRVVEGVAAGETIVVRR